MKKLISRILSGSGVWPAVLVIAIAIICVPTARAVIFDLEVFRYDGRSYDGSGLDFTVSVTETNEDIRFEFCNDLSLIHI